MAAAAAFLDGWSSLPSPLLVDIATRTLSASPLTGSVDDFNAFRSVCTSWRDAASKDVFTKNYPGPWRVPYLMLAEKDGSSEREFFNPATGKITGKLVLPEASGKRCIEARFGWLLTLADSGEVELLNPVSRSQIYLPNFKTFKEFPTEIAPPYRFIRRAVLSANPSETEDFVLVVHTHLNLGFWKNGDENWTRIEKDDKEEGSIEDVAYSEKLKKFFALGTLGHFWSWDPNSSGDLTTPKYLFWVCGIAIGTYSGNVQGYLMEMPSGADGDMLIVTRNGRIPDYRYDCCYPYGATKFMVFKVNVVEIDRVWPVVNLENAAIFVGHNAAVCVPISEFTGLVKPNCIYFSDDSIEAYYLPHVLPLKGKGCKSCTVLYGYDLGNGDCEGENQEGDGDGESKSEEHHGDHKEGCKGEEQEGVGDGESESEEGESEGDDSGSGDGDGDEQGEDPEYGGEEGNNDGEEGSYDWLWDRTNFGALRGGGKNAGIYNIGDGTFERFDKSVETLSFVCPPLWISPPSLSA